MAGRNNTRNGGTATQYVDAIKDSVNDVKAYGLIAAVNEAPIKSLIENAVNEWVTMKPRGKVKEVAE